MSSKEEVIVGRGVPAEAASPTRPAGGEAGPITSTGVLVQERGIAGIGIGDRETTPGRPRVPVGAAAVTGDGPGRVVTAEAAPRRPRVAGEFATAGQLPVAAMARGRTGERAAATGEEDDRPQGRSVRSGEGWVQGPGGRRIVTLDSALLSGGPDEQETGGPGRPKDPPGGGRGRGDGPGVPGEHESGHGDEGRKPAALSMGIPENFGLDNVATVQRNNRTVFRGDSSSMIDGSSRRVEIHVFNDDTIYDSPNTGKGAKALGQLVVSNADDQKVVEVESLIVHLPYGSSRPEVAELAQEVKQYGPDAKETAAIRTAEATQAAIDTLLSTAATDKKEQSSTLAIPGNFAVNPAEYGAKGGQRSVFEGEEVQGDGTTLSLSVKVLTNRRFMHGQPGVRTVGKATLRDAEGKIIARIEDLTIALPHDSDAPSVAQLARNANKSTPDLLEGVVRKTGEATLAALEIFLSPQEQEKAETTIVTAAELRASIAQAAQNTTGRGVSADVWLSTLLQRVDDAAASGRREIALSPGEIATLRLLEKGTDAAEQSHEGKSEAQIRRELFNKLRSLIDQEKRTGKLSEGILVQRALSLMDMSFRRTLLFEDNPAVISRAREQFRGLCTDLDQENFNLKEYARQHPKRRSVLTLLANLDVEIPDESYLQDLRRLALDTLEQRKDLLNQRQALVMADLYGLMDGRVKTTPQVAQRARLHRNTVKNIERVMFGQQSRDYHPERQREAE